MSEISTDRTAPTIPAEQTADDLRKAAELLAKNGWNRILLRNDEGALCIRGAVILAVLGSVPNHLPYSEPLFERVNAAMVAVAGELDDAVLGTDAFEATDVVTAWNDSACPGPEAAVALLRKVADRLESATVGGDDRG